MAQDNDILTSVQPQVGSMEWMKSWFPALFAPVGYEHGGGIGPDMPIQTLPRAALGQHLMDNVVGRQPLRNVQGLQLGPNQLYQMGDPASGQVDRNLWGSYVGPSQVPYNPWHAVPPPRSF